MLTGGPEPPELAGDRDARDPLQVFWLNQVAAREGVPPLRDELARLLRELDAEGSDPGVSFTPD